MLTLILLTVGYNEHGEFLERSSVEDYNTGKTVAYVLDVDSLETHITSIDGHSIYSGEIISEYDIEKLVEKYLETHQGV